MASKATNSDESHITPYKKSTVQEGTGSECDSDYESEDGGPQPISKENIQWTGCRKKTPVILFNPEAFLNKKSNHKNVGERYHMAYKFGNADCKIVRTILNFHGFHEVHPNSSDYNVIWTGGHLKPFTLRSMTEFQKINHFPRSYELTRKDRLYKNVQKMQQLKGYKNFDFVPPSFVLPSEYQDFCSAFLKDKGPWIVKPVASSRGRGVFLVNHPDQIPLDDNIVVCKYLSTPLLIDGFKFDVRLYVAVTSYDPVIIYLYEEGLTRFATVKYEKSLRHLRNQCMHLTNYSVNKKSDDYVMNDDAEVEDYGNKWSLGALLRYLRSNGKDTVALMMRIEDVIIKTILSVELPIATACKMFMPSKGNCFELYGFDILIDESLKPWVLEVNLSPSLACDSPLDLKIKGHMICDLFSLAGIICHDPMMRTLHQSRRNMEVTAKMAARIKKHRPHTAGISAKSTEKKEKSENSNINNSGSSMAGLNSEEIKIMRRLKEEDHRKGGWVRIYPTADSWDLYSTFHQYSTTHNMMVHQRLFPERHKGSIILPKATTASTTSAGNRARSAYIQLNSNSHRTDAEMASSYADAVLRTKQYERKLGAGRGRRRLKHRRTQFRKKERRKLVQGVAEESEGEDENEDIEENEDNEEEMEGQVEKKKNTQEEVIEVIRTEDPKQGNSSNKVEVTNTAKPVAKIAVENNKQVKEEVIRPPPAPLPPVEPQYNVVELLQKGFTLSKVQARSAFAMYLVRVQQRLITDGPQMSQDDMDGLNEQMDLVLRFLKRAAVNLQQNFKVVVPSRKLPFNDRRRILAKQLGDFVHIYNKETDQLKSRKHLEKQEDEKHMDEEKFERFVHIASEGELEEVLTTYTKINKSASIFLGGNPKSSSSSENQASNQTSSSTNSAAATNSAITSNARAAYNSATAANSTAAAQSTTTTTTAKQNNSTFATKTDPPHRRQDSVSEPSDAPPKTITGWEDVPKVIYSVPKASSDGRHSVSHAGTMQPHFVPTSMRTGTNQYNSSASSFASAVQIYTQKLTTLARPRSASAGGSKTGAAGGGGVRSRPSSAHLARPSSATGLTTHDGEPYQDRGLSEALQRLTMRQQARQYSAINSTTVLNPDGPPSRPSSAVGPRPVEHVQVKQWQAQDSNSIAQKRPGIPVNVVKHVSPQSGGCGTIGDISNVTSQLPGRYVAMEDYVSKNRPPSGLNSRRLQSAAGQQTISYRPVQTTPTSVNMNQENANATFNSFIEDSGQSWQNDLAIAYNQVTGVVPQNYHTASQSSKQYELLQQQQVLKQQSKVMLEHSKAKHQAMVAQAHAFQKSLQQNRATPDIQDQENIKQVFAPKPPVQPASSVKRLSSSHRMPRKASPEDSSLNFNFYNSFKDANTGSSRPMVNGGW
ncbi:hypothetical protein CHS0354_039668 [Potamilus streckersoni]|uniref:Tubulin--tyrosine ligase-like protein 5 n=1 Tax=Potamilus streckersoni TaxID=2493646 RepID=A0AAE0SKQ7_9BIVA|nr:hypothetical protein CHS0354_039668 [Potamilus streckersoni]